MRIETRKVLLLAATAVSIACTAAVIFLPAAASASQFIAASAVALPEHAAPITRVISDISSLRVR